MRVTEQTTVSEPEVNIELIMQEIRQQIIARRATLYPDSSMDITVTGQRFSPEFYESLYQARLALDDYRVPVLVSKSTTPLVGGLIDWLRGKFHELVSYYVNQSAARQVAASNHLLRAVSLLAEELDEPAANPDA